VVTHKGAAPPSVVVANRAAQHRVAGFERIEHCGRRRASRYIQQHFAIHLGECPEMMRQLDADHAIACASTESTAGRSRTIGAQLSPPSAEPYTWPPVVPK